MPKKYCINDAHIYQRERQTKASHVVINDSPNGCFPSEAGVARPNEAQDWGQTKNTDVKPVEVIQEVVPGNGR